MSADIQKKRLRTEAKSRRQAAFERHRNSAGETIAAQGLPFIHALRPQVVSGFSSIDDEIDVGPLMARLSDDGFALALPVIDGKGKPLVMRAWKPGEPLQQKTWGIEEPLPDAPEVHPDIVLVPLLAFDAEGYRLGYGGGFYDRTLVKLRAMKPIIAIGVAYDEQRVDVVPRGRYDEPVDWMLTPSGPFRCPGNQR
jgi:5-formyltetrahydrofolate cyclo-ligase